MTDLPEMDDSPPRGERTDYVELDDEEVRDARKERLRRARRFLTRSVQRKRKKAKKMTRYSVESCVINDDWWEAAWANILVARKKSGDRRAVLQVLIDLGCLGVKEWLFEPNMAVDRLEKIERKFFQDTTPVEFDPDGVARMLEHAVTWTEKAGLEVNPGYYVADAFLGDADLFASSDTVPLGREGQHFYVPGPRDDWESTVEELEDELGEEGFKFFIPSGL